MVKASRVDNLIIFCYSFLEQDCSKGEIEILSNIIDLKKLLESSKKIAFFSHTIPDADAICSSLALKNIIETNYKEHNIKNMLAQYAKKKLLTGFFLF